MALWPSTWRQNLPWAGASDAFTTVAEIQGVDIPALESEVAAIQRGNWQVARNAVTPAAGVNELFDVTGRVLVQGVFGVVTTEITRAGGNVEGKVGTETIDDLIIGATANIRAAADLIWQTNATPTVTAATIDLGGDLTFVIGNGDDIILTLDEAPDAGALEFYCFWKPLSADGEVVPA